MTQQPEFNDPAYQQWLYEQYLRSQPTRIQDVTEQFGNNGEVGTSFNVDRDWDSIDGLDLTKLIG